ncbi:hypothetical protein MKW94_004565 [Papaver nudicaule]|uniref:DUF7086 domain-containing protein n=1 Tax=Papaver nudicaule TaxID=74823 RepID=A0AA41SBG5_PAPNU|nr:hypothetical protein [Papaver nudicaule]
MENHKKRYEHEASSSTSSGFEEEDIVLELTLGPSRRYISSSSSSSDSRPADQGIMPPPPPPPRVDYSVGSSTYDNIAIGFTGRGITSGAYKPKDVGFGPFGLGLDIPNGGGGGGGGGVALPIIRGGGGFSIPNHAGNGGGGKNSRLNVRPENVIDMAVPPFEWATHKFAKIHSKDDLISRGIHTITGEVQCKKCEHRCTLEFDLQGKLLEVGSFIYHNKENLAHRAPEHWTVPRLEACPSCDQPNSLKPVMPSDKSMINWLFLLLGQMIGCCTLEQLKYFCDKNSQHRTGAKDRLIFLTYLSLCDQLDPTGPFKLNGC